MDLDLASLSCRSAELSDDLNNLAESCEHDLTRKEIVAVAQETHLLSLALAELHESIEANGNNYTAAFREDLGEITLELKLVFDEVAECCLEMQKADPLGSKMWSNLWFFRKGRVANLQKHLEPLKASIAVMRTVLHHGKDYGAPSSPGRLAESTPHTLFEQRAILDSIFAKNRHAVEDLHKLERSHKHSSSTSSDAQAMSGAVSPGAHGRNLSNATGIDISPIPDVLPTPTNPTRKSTESTRADGELRRRFSKRGVRLGVHASILDMGAHEATEGLRKRWLAAARSAQPSDNSHHKRMTTISEDGIGVAAVQISHTSSGSEESKPGSQPLHTETNLSPGRRRGNSLKLVGSDMGSAMSKIIKKLSVSNDKTSDQQTTTNSKTVDYGFTKKISNRFRQPEITTPEMNKEFENGALASMKSRN